ncbi:MAG TPA: glycosyltransferase family 4 protein [Caldilineaceae bacterium]|mgnify:CR=1 FL=1|nr:glycosyltransferase family 4 protein [Caldilineaceae bacterium]
MSKTILYANPTGGLSGAEISLLLLLKGLDRTRFQPRLVVPDTGSFPARAELLEVPTEIVPFHPFMLESHLADSLRDAVRSLWDFSCLTPLLRRLKPDLIHINSYRIGIPFTRAARSLDIPTIWHIRDIPNSRLKQKLVGYISRWPDKVIAISQAVADALGIHGMPHVSVVYNGVELDLFSQLSNCQESTKLRSEFGLSEKTTILASIGQLIPLKGYDLLIRAFQSVAASFAAHLLIVGGPVTPIGSASQVDLEYPNHLKRLVADCGLTNQVTFTGFRKDIPQILSAADLYVHAATSPEGFGRVLVEAMAAHKPVIAPGWGGSLDIIDPGVSGLFFRPGDEKDLARQLHFALSHPALMSVMGQRGFEDAQRRFGSDQHIAHIQQIYDQLLVDRLRCKRFRDRH